MGNGRKGAALSFDLAVLSVVNDRSSHGYDVWKLFIERYGALFGSGRGEIYKALDRLEEAGLLEMLAPTGRRRNAHYRVNARGASTLVDWIANPLGEAREAEEVHGGVALEHDGGARARAAANGVVVRMRATDDVPVLMRLLDVYESIVRDELEKDRAPRRDRATRWLERLAREAWAAELQWIFWVRAQLRRVGAAAVQTSP